MPRLLGLILILPVLELLAFVLVAGAIGLGKAVLLQLAISLIGVAMLSSLLTEARTRLRGGGGIVTLALGKEHGMRGLAGLLFAIPGFLTDALGVLALVPEVRSRLRAFLGAPEPVARRPEARPAAPATIELDRGEWREAPPRDRA